MNTHSDHNAYPHDPAGRRTAACEAAQRLAGYVLIDGALTPTVSGHQFDVRDPATQERICGAADADADHVEIAVAAAQSAPRGPPHLGRPRRGARPAAHPRAR